MSQHVDIGIFGGDQRQVYMVESFLRKDYSVMSYHLSSEITHEKHRLASSLTELMDHCKILIGPIPMSRDQKTIFSSKTPSDLTITQIVKHLNTTHTLIAGSISLPIIEQCQIKDASYFDLMKNEKITILNSIATAEGTIMEAILGSDQNLHGSECLVLGYGRCAKVLAQKLKGMDAKVTIAARSEEALSYANVFGFEAIPLSELKQRLSSYHFIFNTIPSMVINQEYLDCISTEALIIDIASAPGGVDFEYAKQRNLNAKLCLGLPGKVAPRTSAEFLVTEIIKYLKERSD